MNQPVRLAKVETMSIQDRIEQFVLDHAMFFMILAIVLMLALFITICVMMCGASATESGLQYNQFENII